LSWQGLLTKRFFKENSFNKKPPQGKCSSLSLPACPRLPAGRPACRRAGAAGVLAEPKTNRESILNHFPQSIFILKAKLN